MKDMVLGIGIILFGILLGIAGIAFSSGFLGVVAIIVGTGGLITLINGYKQGW